MASTCLDNSSATLSRYASAAAAAVLLVGPEHDAHRPPRPEPEALHQAHGLPRGDRAAAVVHRALPHVPRVDVPAEHHHLVRLLASHDLGHHVPRRGVGQHARAHPKRHHHLLTAILKPVQHHRVLDAQRRRGNPGRRGVVDRRAGVGAPDRGRGHRADEARHRADPRRGGGAVGANLPDRDVVGERRVEQHDLALRLGRPALELVERAHDQDRRGDAGLRCGHAAAEAQHREPGRPRLHQLGRLRPRAPSAAPSPARHARSRGRRPSSDRAPSRWPPRGWPIR